MDHPPRSIDFDDVIELCGSVATSRGQALKNGGRVSELDWVAEGHTLHAAVQDADPEPVRQRVTIAPHPPPPPTASTASARARRT